VGYVDASDVDSHSMKAVVQDQIIVTSPYSW
jgi:hypothetical protein